MTLETSSTDQASVSGAPMVDQIADLLTENVESEAAQELETSTPVEAEDETEEPTEELEASTDAEELESAPEDDDEDVTWSGVLNVDEGKLAVDEDGNFNGVKVKVDGAESTVDLNTLIAGYQTAKSTTQKSQALAEARKQFDDNAQKAALEFKTKLDEAGQLSQVLQQQLMSDYQGVDWQKLRMENPAEYAAMTTDYQRRQQDIQNISWKIQQDQQVLQENYKQQNAAKQKEFMQDHAKRTLDMFPEWKDPQIAKTAFSEMEEFAKGYGYTAEEFAGIVDSRAIAIIQEAMASRKNADAVHAKMNKPVPKFRKSTQRRPAAKKATKLDKLVGKVNKAKGSNKRDLQAAAIGELLISEKI